MCTCGHGYSIHGITGCLHLGQSVGEYCQCRVYLAPIPNVDTSATREVQSPRTICGCGHDRGTHYAYGDCRCKSCRCPVFTVSPLAADNPQLESTPLDQPPPKPEDTSKPAVWPLVIVDMCERDRVGRARYGTPLQPNNGRDALKDAYQEALDLAAYLRQAIHERDGK
jgi:hypothetical protein